MGRVGKKASRRREKKSKRRSKREREQSILMTTDDVIPITHASILFSWKTHTVVSPPPASQSSPRLHQHAELVTNKIEKKNRKKIEKFKKYQNCQKSDEFDS